MKTIIVVCINLLVGLLTTKAQTITTSSSSSATKVTVSIDGDSEEEYTRSYTVIDMEKAYRVKIRFMNHLIPNVQSYLKDEFGKENVLLADNAYIWKKELDDEEMYTVKLEENKVRIRLNKEVASDKMNKRFIRIAKDLKSLTSNSEKE